MEQASEDELANAAALADLRHVHLPAHRRGSGRAVQADRTRRNSARTRGGDFHRAWAKVHQFKVGYHEGRLAEVESEFANPQVYLPADARVVKENIERKLQP